MDSSDTMLLEIDDELFDNEALKNTAYRWKAFTNEWLCGDEINFSLTTFDSNKYDQMISLTGIRFYSLCSHHVLPFFGYVHVAYVPNKHTIAGISKLARVADHFARRPQTQECMTHSIAGFLDKHEEFNPKGVMVVTDARHLCMEMRGVQKPGTITTMNAIRGVFAEPPKGKNPRAEFEHIIARNAKEVL